MESRKPIYASPTKMQSYKKLLKNIAEGGKEFFESLKPKKLGKLSKITKMRSTRRYRVVNRGGAIESNLNRLSVAPLENILQNLSTTKKEKKKKSRKTSIRKKVTVQYCDPPWAVKWTDQFYSRAPVCCDAARRNDESKRKRPQIKFLLCGSTDKKNNDDQAGHKWFCSNNPCICFEVNMDDPIEPDVASDFD